MASRLTIATKRTTEKHCLHLGIETIECSLRPELQLDFNLILVENKKR